MPKGAGGDAGGGGTAGRPGLEKLAEFILGVAGANDGVVVDEVEGGGGGDGGAGEAPAMYRVAMWMTGRPGPAGDTIMVSAGFRPSIGQAPSGKMVLRVIAPPVLGGFPSGDHPLPAGIGIGEIGIGERCSGEIGIDEGGVGEFGAGRRLWRSLRRCSPLRSNRR